MESSKTNENINLKNNDLLMHINEELNQIIDYIQTNFDNNNIEMDFEKEEYGKIRKKEKWKNFLRK